MLKAFRLVTGELDTYMLKAFSERFGFNDQGSLQIYDLSKPHDLGLSTELAPRF